jgi:hypothetical protein
MGKKLFILFFLSFSLNAFADLIGEQRTKITQLLDERLKIYQAEHLQISLNNARNAIKSVFISDNIYYQIEFDSKKDKQHYKCDMDYVAGKIPMHELGIRRPAVFILNCKYRKETDQNANVERILNAQYPTLARPGTVKIFSNDIADMNDPLRDDYNYEVIYEDAKTGEKKNCPATLLMDLRPYSLVDQSLMIKADDCKILKVIDTRTVAPPKNYNPLECMNAEHLLAPEVAQGQLTFLNKLYDFYSDELDKRWPLLKKKDVLCTNIPDYWKMLADSMISLDFIKLKSKTKEEKKLEEIMLRNALINQAYNRLYVQSQSEKNGDSLQWLAAASHSSPIVGRSLRTGFVNNVDSDNYEKKSFGLGKLIQNDETKTKGKKMISAYFEKRAQVMVMAGEGNKAVFDDMYWQNLAAAYCGPELVETMLKEKVEFIKTRASHTSFYEGLENHYTELQKAWEMIKDGKKKNPPDQKLIEEGNMLLLQIEQKDILQSQMYESKEAKIVHKLGVFNSLAKADLADASGKKLQTFDEYASAHKLENDLSNLNSRLEWMKYILENQTDYIKENEEKGLIKEVFMPPLYESYLLLSDYK